MDSNKRTPILENCGTYSTYDSNYNNSCECKTCLSKKLKILIKYFNELFNIFQSIFRKRKSRKYRLFIH